MNCDRKNFSPSSDFISAWIQAKIRSTPTAETIRGSKNIPIRIKIHNVVNGSSYLRLTSKAEGLNVGENSQAKLDVSTRAGFTTLENKQPFFASNHLVFGLKVGT